MNACERYEKSIRAYIAGDPVPDDLETLVEHCRLCEDCRRLLQTHRTLSDLGARFEQLEDVDLSPVRAGILEQVSRPGRLSILLAPFALRPLAAAAAVIVVFVLGVLAASMPFGVDDDTSHRLVSDITAEALSNRSLVDVENSPYTYSNVSFRQIGDDRVALAFDTTMHVEIVEPVRSELVREVLVHSLVNPTHTGSRLKALSYASGVMEPKVLGALTFAMHNDDNLAVRLKALSILAAQPAGPEVESAVLAVLSGDESVQMRLQALDYLATHSVDSDRIRQAIGESGNPGGEALQMRLAKYES